MKEWVLAAGAACGLTASVVLAQTTPPRLDRTLEQIRRDTRLLATGQVPPEQRVLVDYGAYLTASYLSLDDPDNNNHGLRQVDLVVYGRFNLDDAHEAYIRGRGFYQDYNPGDSFENEGDGFDGRLEEAYYRFDLRRYVAAKYGRSLSGNLQAKVGRQFVTWASGLTFSDYLDAALVSIEAGPIELKLLAGLTPLDTIDFDPSRPEFDEHTERAFFGAMLEAKVGAHRPFVYILQQRDYNPDTVLSIGDINTSFRYDSYYIGAGSQGALSDHLVYRAELVYEGGQSLSRAFDGDPPQPARQTSDDIEAFAGDFALGYVWSDIHKPRVSLELMAATGDDDRLDAIRTVSGNRPGTLDRGFNAFGLVQDGLAFAPALSNVAILRAGGSLYPLPNTSPFRKLQVGTDIYICGKFDKDAPIDEPSTQHRFLGIEPDVWLNWAILEDLTLVVRYGVFFPGDGLPSDDARQFIYVGLTYSF